MAQFTRRLFLSAAPVGLASFGKLTETAQSGMHNSFGTLPTEELPNSESWPNSTRRLSSYRTLQKLKNKRFSLGHSLRVLALGVALAAVMIGVQASRTGFGRSPTDMLHFPELDTGFQLLYQLKFVEARAQFEKWQTSHPEGALGYASEAASYLFEESYRLGILTSDFFLDDKRFLGTTPVNPDPKQRQAFFDSNKRAQDVAQLRLKENADNPNALFAMAISLGMEADYAGLIEKHQLDSLKKTREAEAYSKNLLKVAPDAYDAYLGLGMANYIIGSLPGSKKFFLGFAGIHGNKKKGIQQLEITAKEGRYLRPFAKILLALTALREKRPEMARTELTELVSEFPENPLFASELAKLNASPAVGTANSSIRAPIHTRRFAAVN